MNIASSRSKPEKHLSSDCSTIMNNLTRPRPEAINLCLNCKATWTKLISVKFAVLKWCVSQLQSNLTQVNQPEVCRLEVICSLIFWSWYAVYWTNWLFIRFRFSMKMTLTRNQPHIIITSTYPAQMSCLPCQMETGDVENRLVARGLNYRVLHVLLEASEHGWGPWG